MNIYFGQGSRDNGLVMVRNRNRNRNILDAQGYRNRESARRRWAKDNGQNIEPLI